jgi:hypothetical protein
VQPETLSSTVSTLYEQLTTDQDVRVRRTAARLLGELRVPETDRSSVVGVLCERLEEEPDAGVRVEVVASLAKIAVADEAEAAFQETPEHAGLLNQLAIEFIKA